MTLLLAESVIFSLYKKNGGSFLSKHLRFAAPCLLGFG